MNEEQLWNSTIWLGVLLGFGVRLDEINEVMEQLFSINPISLADIKPAITRSRIKHHRLP